MIPQQKKRNNKIYINKYSRLCENASSRICNSYETNNENVLSNPNLFNLLQLLVFSTMSQLRNLINCHPYCLILPRKKDSDISIKVF